MCERIWEVVNPDYDELFSKQQYYLCMALIAKAREGIDVPTELPPSLVQSAMEACDPSPKNMGLLDKQQRQPVKAPDPVPMAPM